MQTQQFELHADIELRHWWFRGRREIMVALIHQILPAAPGRTILDVGCGTGGNLGVLSREYRCLGIDSSEEAIARARIAHPEASFVCGSLSPGGNGIGKEADLFLLMDVLEHVPDDFLLLSEVVSAARPGAYLLITVPADMRLWTPHDVSFGHYRRYDRQRLAALWEGLPVSPRLVSHFNSRLYPLIRGVRQITRVRGRSFGRAGTDFRIPAGPINAMLERIFAREARVLSDLLAGRRGEGYRRGASLIAVLRREFGAAGPRRKPPGIPPDPHQPGADHGP